MSKRSETAYKANLTRKIRRIAMSGQHPATILNLIRALRRSDAARRANVTRKNTKAALKAWETRRRNASIVAIRRTA